ncbi:MAG: HAMP domain-containing histidine kinase [Syntrophomonadaceae bacterium]|jgi:signal transduction histidine kinase|nr:HAMP domain-containing histidine kinase [Syntrophomonadaceae bacterium]
MKKLTAKEEKSAATNAVRHYLLHLAQFILLILVIYILYLPAQRFTGFILDKTGMPAGDAGYFISVILGAIFLCIFFALVWHIARQKHIYTIQKSYSRGRFKNGYPRSQWQSGFNFLEDFYLALGRIAQGDYDIFIKPDNNFFGKQILNDLATRINHMAGQLKSMEEMRQDFISNVSHEIQSPITSIKGFAVLLKNENLPEEERLSYIKIIETECNRLSKLSGSLLKLSTLDSGVTTINAAKFNIVRQLRDTALSLEPLWRDKNLKIEIDGEETELEADRELLAQVWINLLSNSIKFTPSGGKIMMEARKDKDGDNIAVILTDNGEGIAPDDQPYIFERFFMADKSRHRDECGNGLGLSIVKKIIDMHRGNINVSSVQGEGTVFTVSLPKIYKTHVIEFEQRTLSDS